MCSHESRVSLRLAGILAGGVVTRHAPLRISRRAVYSEQAKVQADRQADSRENADLRTQLSKRETEVLQLQEKVNAAQREVETWCA
eukprot:COSAG04_NODE_1618_length_6139_cov_3.891060_4_plen_86_part_00